MYILTGHPPQGELQDDSSPGVVRGDGDYPDGKLQRQHQDPDCKNIIPNVRPVRTPTGLFLLLY